MDTAVTGSVYSYWKCWRWSSSFLCSNIREERRCECRDTGYRIHLPLFQIVSMSSSAGGGPGEGGVVDLVGVEGGEGNRVGWMEEGEEGSCLVGEERGKNKTGWIGETGGGVACFVGERGGDVASLVRGETGACWVGEDGGEEAG